MYVCMHTHPYIGGGEARYVAEQKTFQKWTFLQSLSTTEMGEGEPSLSPHNG